MDLISVSQVNKQKFKVNLRKHEFFADMSIQDKGEDQAPSPSELLVGAYGSCVGMIIHRYCESHGIESKDINLDMTFQLADNPKRIGNITVDVTLPEGFPEDRKKVVYNLAKTCVSRYEKSWLEQIYIG